jgi:hypothetical protein
VLSVEQARLFDCLFEFDGRACPDLAPSPMVTPGMTTASLVVDHCRPVDPHRVRDRAHTCSSLVWSVADYGLGAHQELIEVGVVRDARLHPVGRVVTDVQVLDRRIGEQAAALVATSPI